MVDTNCHIAANAPGNDFLWWVEQCTFVQSSHPLGLLLSFICRTLEGGLLQGEDLEAEVDLLPEWQNTQSDDRGVWPELPAA